MKVDLADMEFAMDQVLKVAAERDAMAEKNARLRVQLSAAKRLKAIPAVKCTLCRECGQPMLPPGETKRENEYDHARGCPLAPGYWLIHFEDADMKPEIFTSEAVARDRFKALQQNWNCTLFQEVKG
jgi:hypothetical protein